MTKRIISRRGVIDGGALRVTLPGLLFVVAGLSGCNLRPPDTGAAPSAAAEAAPYPALLAQSELRAISAAPPGPRAADTAAPLDARSRALAARTARLSGPVLDPATRAQLDAAACESAGRAPECPPVQPGE